MDTPIHDGNGSSMENSMSTNAVLEARAAGQYLYFPCGLIRGALTNLGVPCDVSAEVASLPGCKYITHSFQLYLKNMNLIGMKWRITWRTLIEILINELTIVQLLCNGVLNI